MLIMGTIFFLSHQRGDELHLPDFHHSDLLAHLVAYAVLGGTILYAWSERYKRKYPRRIVLFTVLVCLLYGISDEFHQYFIPGRYVSGLDVLADTLGGILACSVWWVLQRQRNNLRMQHS